MKRRQFLINTAAIIGTASLARPGVVRAASASTLKFVPYADLAVLDPLGSAFVTRNHVMMVFDTLFALDANGDAQPQMLAGYTVEEERKPGSSRCVTGCCSTTAARCWRATWWPACGAGRSGTRSARR
jgi:hypothetical protein